MNRQEKEQVIKSLREDFTSSQAAFVVGYKGLTVQDLSGLRTQLRNQGGSLKVAKVNLMKLAIDNTEEQAGALTPLLDGQIAMVFAKDEPVGVAKALRDFSKKKEALQILAGFFEQRLLDVKQVNALASLPSREVLLAQLCGVLQATAASLARALNMHAEKLAEGAKPAEKVEATEAVEAVEAETASE